MIQVSKAVSAHNRYCEKFSKGVLNAPFESELTSAISLSDSSLIIPYLSLDFLSHIKEVMTGKLCREMGN